MSNQLSSLKRCLLALSRYKLIECYATLRTSNRGLEGIGKQRTRWDMPLFAQHAIFTRYAIFGIACQLCDDYQFLHNMQGNTAGFGCGQNKRVWVWWADLGRVWKSTAAVVSLSHSPAVQDSHSDSSSYSSAVLEPHRSAVQKMTQR